MSKRPVGIEERLDKYLVNQDGHWFLNYGNKMHMSFYKKGEKQHINVRRYLYEKHIGKKLGKKVVHCACKFPNCINPSHLFMKEYSSAKLNKDQVKEIRAKWKVELKAREKREKERVTLQTIGDKYGVSRQMIDYIVREVCWK